MNWTTPTIVKASEVVVGDRMKRQARVGNLVMQGQYLQVVKVVMGTHPKDSTREGIVITMVDMKTKAKKTEFQGLNFEMGVYRD